MNFCQTSDNEPIGFTSVRPLTGPENGGQGGSSGQFKPDEAPTVKVYPPANQSPAIRPVKKILPPSLRAPAEPILSPQHLTDEPKVSINLKSLLLGIPVTKLGFNPDQIPSSVLTELPVSLVEPMMATGQVDVRLGDIIGGCLERYRPAFAKADTNERVSLPMQELQNQIPQNGPAGPTQESPFAQASGEPTPGSVPANPFQAAPVEGGAPASPFTAEVSPAPNSPFQNPFGQAEAPAAGPAEQQAASPFAAVGAKAGHGHPFAAPVTQRAFDLVAGAEETPFANASTSGDANPFAAPDSVLAQETASPFAAVPQQEANSASAPAENPFAAPADGQPASPFGVPPATATATATEEASPFVAALAPGETPFVVSAKGQPASRFGTSPAEGQPASPFGAAPFGAQAESNGASPFGTSAPDANARSPFGGAPEPEPRTVEPAAAAMPVSEPNVQPQAPAPFPEASAPAEEPAGAAFPAAAVAAPSLPAAALQQGRGFDFGFQDDPNQLALRAVFSVDTTLSSDEVLDHTTKLAGIHACVLIEKKTGATKVGRSSDDGRAHAFEGQAKQAYNKVISLADDLQITDAETFTLRTAQGAMSFFNSPNACLAVLHQESEFPPGVREKLILVIRDLSSMVS